MIVAAGLGFLLFKFSDLESRVVQSGIVVQVLSPLRKSLD
jgi:hypothetical protein